MKLKKITSGVTGVMDINGVSVDMKKGSIVEVRDVVGEGLLANYPSQFKKVEEERVSSKEDQKTIKNLQDHVESLGITVNKLEKENAEQSEKIKLYEEKLTKLGVNVNDLSGEDNGDEGASTDEGDEGEEGDEEKDKEDEGDGEGDDEGEEDNKTD